MRVLLLFPMADGQTGPAIKYAFEQLGHEVMAVDAKIESFNSYAVACHFMPTLIFCSRTYQLTEQVEQIKRKFKDAKIACWNVDTRNSIHEWEFLFPLIKLCDYYFVVASKLIPDWQKINPNTHWLPQGLQDEVYHKPDEITDEDKERYSCDVSFTGGIHGYHAWRQPYLEAVADAGFNFKFWGFLDSRKVYNEEHNKAVFLSKINLGMSGWASNESYVSVRDYKILGAGGFLMELTRPGLFDVMPIGGLATYESPDDLVRMVEFHLKNEDVNKAIAEVGHDFVHKLSRYTNRIQKALEIMGLK